MDFLFARERGEVYDPAAFDACMAAAVMENVRRQKVAGIYIVSDGECSKISYATYVKDRYTGFSGDSPRNAPNDLKCSQPFWTVWPNRAAHRNMRGRSAPGL